MNMYNRIDFDYKRGLKRYRRLNQDGTEWDFLTNEIKILKQEKSKLESKSDEQILSEWKIKNTFFEKITKASHNDKELFLEARLSEQKGIISRRIKEIENHLLEYDINLNRLPKPNTEEKLKNENNKKLPYKIALLNELGFFDLPKIKKLSTNKSTKILMRLIGGTERQLKGNINVLNPDSNEDRLRYTSASYENEVKKFIRNLSIRPSGRI